MVTCLVGGVLYFRCVFFSILAGFYKEYRYTDSAAMLDTICKIQ